MQTAQTHTEPMNTVIATGSGLAGGAAVMIKTGVLQMITIEPSRIVEVAIYSAISAGVGYGIKLVFDFVKEKFFKR